MIQQKREEIDIVLENRWDSYKTTNHQTNCKNCDLINVQQKENFVSYAENQIILQCSCYEIHYCMARNTLRSHF